jgi:4-amino-4-deoxy-L-arabinose transferase-like glycosyltransferase
VRALATRWRTEPARSIGLGAGLALALHLPFVGGALQPDEGGYLLVARHWHDDGGWLYGQFWVDRPPLLILAFRLVDTLLGPDWVRVLACVAAVVLAAAGGWSGWLVRGAAGARWAGLTAAAIGSSYAVGASTANGEILAAPFMMLSCACILYALHRADENRRRALWAAAAGVAGSSAVLVKQNFVDALVFCGVLLLAMVWRGDLPRRSGLRLLGWLAAGAALPVAATLGWAYQHGAGAGQLWYMLYGFRAAALEAIADQEAEPVLTRLVLLAGLAVLSGIVMLAWRFLHASRSQLRRGDPCTLAVVAMLGTGLAGILLGGSYWSHYLIQMGPALALGSAAVGARTDRHGHRMRRWVGVAVASAVIAAATGVAATAADLSSQRPAMLTGKWLGTSAEPRDTAVVIYGQPNVLATAGLTSPYPYLWSLPVRILDRDLSRLVRTLRGPHSPTWLVEWRQLNSWGLDRHGRLAATLDTFYRQVATVCGAAVYLRTDVSRDLARPPADCAVS